MRHVFVVLLIPLQSIMETVSIGSPGTAIAWLTMAANSQDAPTTTTTQEACKLAHTGCECAALPECAFAASAGGDGSGNCFHVGPAFDIPHVDCPLCPTQDHCPGSTCPLKATACACEEADECSWNGVSETCLPRKDGGKNCLACPTQAGCSYTEIRAVNFEPRNVGVYGGGNNLQISVYFNVAVTACEEVPTTGAPPAFWCLGSSRTWPLRRDQVTIAENRFRADVSSFLPDIRREGERECGLSIGRGEICDRQGIPYSGLTQSQYSFSVRDATAPELAFFDPRNGATGVNQEHITITFSEDIAVGNGAVTLSRLEVSSSGAAAASEVATFPTTSKDVTANAASLRVYLGGIIRPGFLYTLAVPRGAVIDLAGNEFVGLNPHVYTFRAGTTALRAEGTSSGDTGASLAVVILVVVAVVAIVGVATVGATFMMRSQPKLYSNDNQPYRIPPQPAVQPMPVPLRSSNSSVGQPANNGVSHQASVGSRTSQNKPVSETNDWREEQDVGYGSWAYKSPPDPRVPPRPSNASAAPTGSSFRSSRVHPGPSTSDAPSNAARGPQASGSRPSVNSAGSVPPRSASKSSVENTANACPEVQAVERQLRAAMDEPSAAKKKLLKDLMLEYHPDKNSREHAKEVFQYVNNARGWFLVDA